MDPEDQHREKDHINKAHKHWLPIVGHRMCLQTKWPAHQRQPQARGQKKKKTLKGLVTTPYVRNLTESVHQVFQSYGVQAHNKPSSTLRQLLVWPKDPTPPRDICGAVYHITCEGRERFVVGTTLGRWNEPYRKLECKERQLPLRTQ